MSLVKWVDKETRLYSAVSYRDKYTPVVELSALTELVEGLKEINAKSVIAYSIAPELSATACLEINKVTQRLLTQLEAHI